MKGLLHCTARAALWLGCATMVAAPLAAAAPSAKIVTIAAPLSAGPAAAAAWSSADEVVEQRRWRRHRHHNGIDGGDVLGGLLILGGIAAVAAAIDKSQDEQRRDRTRGRDYPYDDRPYDDRPYDDRGYPDRPYDYRDRDRDRNDDRWGGGVSAREADRAIDACSAEAERSGRVDEIFDVDKIDGEWRVRGDFTNGREFTCTVDSSGRAFIGVGARSDAAGSNPRDDGDDRYATAQAPDFEDARGR